MRKFGLHILAFVVALGGLLLLAVSKPLGIVVFVVGLILAAVTVSTSGGLGGQ